MSYTIRGLTQAVLRHFGYQLVHNSRPKALIGTHSDPASPPVPESIKIHVRSDNPRLLELRKRYSKSTAPVLGHTWWTQDYVDSTLDLVNFRGDNAYAWQTRHMAGQAIRHRYYLYACDVAKRDGLRLFNKLSEDGAFGCWTQPFRRFRALSRDLLDSVNELNFLERHAGVTRIEGLGVLDIGAGYGRLAHRSVEALPNLKIYLCTDTVPESTFLSEFYLKFRGCEGKARVVAADRLDELQDHSIHVAVNVHSFSEMNTAAIEGWLDLVGQLDIPYLFIVPNDAEAFLSVEADGTRRDFLDTILTRGYKLIAKEPAICDVDTRELVGVNDHLFLFRRGRIDR